MHQVWLIRIVVIMELKSCVKASLRALKALLIKEACNGAVIAFHIINRYKGLEKCYCSKNLPKMLIF